MSIADHLERLRAMASEETWPGHESIRVVLNLVDKLPKDADGVPAANDTRLYFVHPELDEIWSWQLKLIPQPHVVSHVGDDECSVLLPEDGHVSRVAAEAELKRRKGERR